MSNAAKLARQCEDVLASVLGLSLHFLETLRFNQNDVQQLYSVCLYSRLLELATASKALMEKKALVGIPVMLRSMIEADIDLTNLMKYGDYSKRMYATYLKQKLRLTKQAASAISNPFFTEVKKHRDVKKDLEEIQKELEAYIKKNTGPISIRSKAELAGKMDEYLSVYNLLCLETHNNINSLEDWHIESKTLKNYQAVAFKLQMSDLIPYLFEIYSILLGQTKSLAEFLGTKDVEFKRYFDEMAHLRKAVIKSQETRDRQVGGRS